MLLLTCLALSHLRLCISLSIVYTASACTHCSFLDASALHFSLSAFHQHPRPYVLATLYQKLLGTSVPGVRYIGPAAHTYGTMAAKGIKGLNAMSKAHATEDETAPVAARTKRELEGALVEQEGETQDQLLAAKLQSSNIAALGMNSAAVEKEEGTEDLGPDGDSRPAKKRRGAPKARAKAGKKHATATTAPQSSPLQPDEEFNALAALAAKSRKFVGAHISAAGGVHNALISCFNVKGQAFALFLKCQRKWVSSPLTETAINGFKERCDQLEMDMATQVLPHGSYLINVANPDKTKQENAYKALLDDLQRCETLGIKLYNIHPGSTVGDCSKEEGIRNIAAAVNRAHKDTKFVVVVLENMAGQKNVVGSKFEDLRDIIDLVEDKDRVGVCLDTCHLFAAGYDIRNAEKFEKVMEEFDSIVGYKFLKGMHLNDSKSQLSSGLDRHELLGKGHLGLEPFKYIMRHPSRFKDMPLILETPDPTEGSIWKKEIKQMYSFLDAKEE